MSAAEAVQFRGEYPEAIKMYNKIVKGIEKSLEDRKELWSAEDIATAKKVLQETKDVIIALQSVLMLTGFDTGGEGVEFVRGNNDNEPELATYDQLLRSYRLLQIITTLTLIFQPITLCFLIALLVESINTELACLQVFIAMCLYFPLNLVNILTAVMLKLRFRKIKYDYRRLDRRTNTAHRRGSLGYYLEIYSPLVSILKLIWFIFSFVTIIIEADCGSKTAYNLFVVVAVIGCLEFWLMLLACFCMPCICCCLFYAIYRVYRDYMASKPKGIRNDVLARLESQSFHESQTDENQNTCPICLDEFTADDRLRFLPCKGKHSFHKHCIDEWLIQNDTCPQCREHMNET